MLMTLGDFAEFKDLMLHYKSELAGSGGGAMAAHFVQQQQQQQRRRGTGGGTGAAAGRRWVTVGKRQATWRRVQVGGSPNASSCIIFLCYLVRRCLTSADTKAASRRVRLLVFGRPEQAAARGALSLSLSFFLCGSAGWGLSDL